MLIVGQENINIKPNTASILILSKLKQPAAVEQIVSESTDWC